MYKKIFFSCLPFMAFAMVSCSGDTNQNKGRDLSGETQTDWIKGKSAPEWQGMLKRYSGWIGADGVYAVALNGVTAPGVADTVESLFWFSDSIIGEIENDSLKKWDMVNNSIAYMKGSVPDTSKMTFHYNLDENGKPRSVFIPNTPNTTEGEYYWLGDGFFNHAQDSSIYIFGYKVMNVPGQAFPFKQTGVCLISIPKGSRFPFSDQRQLDTPLFFESDKGVTFYGASVLPNTTGARTPKPDGYVYVYGVRRGDLVVARVRDSAFDNFSEWRFWDSKDWNPDKYSAQTLITNVSNEMSVSYMEDGRVIAVFQKDGISPDIMVQVGNSPTGPFFPSKKVYETPEVYHDIDFYTYNAKAFPHLSKKGELLISYNVNAFDFAYKIEKYPHHLRPRFITVKYQ